MQLLTVTIEYMGQVCMHQDRSEERMGNEGGEEWRGSNTRAGGGGLYPPTSSCVLLSTEHVDDL